MKKSKTRSSSSNQSKRSESPFFSRAEKVDNSFFSQKSSIAPFIQSTKKEVIKEDKINSKAEQEGQILPKSESPVVPERKIEINTKKEEAESCSNVAPTENQTVNNPGADNSCTPSFPKIEWDVVSKDASNWGVCVSALKLEGDINIKPWANKPTTMTVPNTPNPVDGGNINNTAGSDNRWKAAVDDMKDYNKAGGGAGPNWHSVSASIAHENAHWSTDWLKDSILDSAAGDWKKANKEINQLTEPKADSPTQAEAKTKLTPKVDAKRISFGNKAITKYNSIPDTPGDAKGAGYKAGERVLSGLIASVTAYKTTKGW
ncbi:MAG: hypothetical protein JW764_06630 [Chlorobiaceae bacterium]|nr:hypothetical protein [Chlorobiaceae bacterium]